MRKLYLSSCILIAVLFSQAQNPVPNSSFEQWSGGDPTNWSNSQFVSQATPGHTGSYAVKGEKTASTFPHLSAGSGSGFAVTQNYAYMNLYYKFNRIDSEYLAISVQIRDAGAAAYGFGNEYIYNSASNFTALSIPISYSASNTPSTALIDVYIADPSGGNPPNGSYFIIDDVSLTSTATSAEEIEQPISFYVSPNPSSDFLQVRMDANSDEGLIVIRDLSGREIKSQPVTGEVTWIPLDDVQTGLYLLTITQNGVCSTAKIQVAR